MPINTSHAVFDSFTENDRQLFVNVFDFCLGAERSLTEKSKTGVKVPDWNCHVVARMINLVFPKTKVVDGRQIGLKLVEVYADPNNPDAEFSTEKTEVFSAARTTVKMFTATHSWVTTPDGNIIDGYPCGVYAIGPIMVTADSIYGHFGANHYQELACANTQFDETEAWATARKLLEIAEVTYPVNNNAM